MTHLQSPAIVLCRCHLWGQCSLCECFLLVCLPFPQGSSKREACTAFLKFIKFSVSFPHSWYSAGSTDRRTLEFLPGREHTVSSFKRLHVTTLSFFINLSEDREVYLQRERWDSCSHSRRILTPNLPCGSKFSDDQLST